MTGLFVKLFFIFGTMAFLGSPVQSRSLSKSKNIIDVNWHARSIASTVNNYKTVGDFLAMAQLFFSDSEAKNIKALLKSRGIKLTDKMPKLKSSGNRVKHKKMQMAINGNGSFNLEGKVYYPKRQSADALLKLVLKNHVKKTTSRFKIFPEASAVFGFELGTLAVIAVVIAGVMWIGSKVADGVDWVFKKWRRLSAGEATCHKKYGVKITGKAIGTNSPETEILYLPPFLAAQLMSSPGDAKPDPNMKCTPDLAKNFTNSIQGKHIQIDEGGIELVEPAESGS